MNETKTEKIIVYELCTFKTWPGPNMKKFGQQAKSFFWPFILKKKYYSLMNWTLHFDYTSWDSEVFTSKAM